MADHHVLGLFTEEHAAVQSLKDLRNLGLPERAVTVMSSIPIPETWPGPTWLRQRGAAFAVLGAILGVGLGLTITMASYLLYQIIVGQQPLTPVPPTGIVTFEITMLGTMATTFIGFLILNRLPALWRPRYDVEVTEGQIGVLVLAGDDLLAAVENALRQAGAGEVRRLAPNLPNNRLWNRAIAGTIVILGLVGIVVVLFLYDILSIPFPTNMANQLSTGYQQGPRRAAPAEAVPIQGPALIAGQPGTQPVAATPNSLQRGQVLYNINCALCHGAGGKGDGPLSKYFNPKPVDLTSNNVRQMSDQDLYVVITLGFGQMPQIGENLLIEERWDVVNYVHTLKVAKWLSC